MKRAVVILVAIFAFNSAYANDDNATSDQNLINEVKAEMENPVFFDDETINEPDVLIYSYQGELLHSFYKENIDPVAMRNVELLLESNSQKIFIKEKELNPSI